MFLYCFEIVKGRRQKGEDREEKESAKIKKSGQPGLADCCQLVE